MNIKSFSVLTIIFLLQLAFSCGPCNCISPVSLEVTYHSVTVTPWDTSGFQSIIVEDTVHKNAFGLGVGVEFDLVEIASKESPRNSFGFASALACDCLGDEYTYPNSIDYVEIFVTDTQTDETTNATSLFATQGYGDDGLIPLSELFENRAEWHDGFQFELMEFSSIPNSSKFQVIVYLESGVTFNNQTNQINFF